MLPCLLPRLACHHRQCSGLRLKTALSVINLSAAEFVEGLAWLLTIGAPADSISSRRGTSKLVTPMCRIFDPFTYGPMTPCRKDT